MSGSMRSIAGGKMTFTAKKIRVESTDGDLQLHSAKDTVFNAKGKITYDEYAPRSGNTINIVRGWWTDTEDIPITEALAGNTVHFHIETRGIPNGGFVFISLFEDDRLVNGAEDGEDDRQPLVKAGTGAPFLGGTVQNGRVKTVIALQHLEGLIAAEPDRMLELYCRISYLGQNTDLPRSTADYLKVIALPLVVDRYKLPGLNAEATDIADDMAYGYGVKHEGPVYSPAEIAAYLADYTERGWNLPADAPFANIETAAATSANSQVPASATVRPGAAVQSDPVPADHTRVAPVIVPPALPPAKAKYSRAEILSHRSWLMNLSEAGNVNALQADFRLLKAGMVWGALSPVLDAMIDKFFGKEGGIFEDAALTASIAANASTRRYCDLVEDYIAEHLKTNKSLIGLEQRAPEFGDAETLRNARVSKGFWTPLYPYNREGNLLAGRTLALNDIWATEIILMSFTKTGNNYEGSYKVTLWDHFGIDAPDMDKFFSYGAGFRAWFLLQHLHGYKPFLTKITFNCTFKGNLQQGGKERVAERQAQQRSDAAQEERLRQMSRKKPGEF